MPTTPLPTPPSRQDPANFAVRGDAFLGALPQFQEELNELQTDVATNTTAAAGSASAAATSATAAAGSATSAGTSATNAASSATAAGSSASSASTSASTATTKASEAATSATNAASSASAAATSASSASTSASTATTKASEASTSASNAASSASSASTSATNAASSASSASTSATNAGNSASAAATSATAASGSATSAAVSAAAAAAALDEFTDTYLGAKSSDPTVDNDGNPLTVGDQYFNTVNNELRIYNGSAWQSAAVVGGTINSLTVNNDSYHYGVRVGRGGGASSTNTVVGAGALASNTSGIVNVALGEQALLSNTTGGYNVAVGRNNLYSNTTGSNNIAIGFNTLYYSNGSGNVAVGGSTLANTTTGGQNTAFGLNAGYSNTTGSTNDFFGINAGYSNTTGVNNAYLGTSAGYWMTTGSKNTILGSFSGNNGGLDIRTANNYVVLSDGDGYPALWGQGGDSGYMKLQAGRLEFPATQNPSSNANTLDDYEEGTFTPALADGTYTYSNGPVGRYIKIGKKVHIHIGFRLNTASGVGGSNAQITGLPFECESLGGYAEYGSSSALGGGFVTPALSYSSLWFASGTTLNIRNMSTNTDTPVGSNSVWQAGTFLKLEMSYLATS